jgi:hypothetical protein
MAFQLFETNNVISTRRLRARPVAVALSSTGSALGTALGLHALGLDGGQQQVAHRVGARLRQVPVGREAQRADGLAVGVAGDQHRAGHLGQRLAR